MLVKMLFYRCSQCLKTWSKLLNDGCLFCDAPCEVIESPRSSSIAHDDTPNQAKNMLEGQPSSTQYRSPSSDAASQIITPFDNLQLETTTQTASIDREWPMKGDDPARTKPIFHFTAGNTKFSVQIQDASPKSEEANSVYENEEMLTRSAVLDEATTMTTERHSSIPIPRSPISVISEAESFDLRLALEFESEDDIDGSIVNSDESCARDETNTVNETKAIPCSNNKGKELVLVPNKEKTTKRSAISTYRELTSAPQKAKKRRRGQKRCRSKKPVAQLELPEPIPLPRVRARNPWNEVVSNRQSDISRRAEALIEERKQVNARSPFTSYNNVENEDSEGPINIRVGLHSKHDMRMMLSRSVVEP